MSGGDGKQNGVGGHKEDDSTKLINVIATGSVDQLVKIWIP